MSLLWEQYQNDSTANVADLPDLTDFSPASTESKNQMINSAEAYVHWQMDRDKKTTSLKQLQGNIWLAGYKSGKLSAQ